MSKQLLDVTTFKRICPVLASADIARDLAWYAEKTGFTNIYDSSNYNDFNQPLDYAVIARQNQIVHLQWHANTKADPVYGGTIKFEVQNIRPLFEEFVQRGTVNPDAFRANTPWGTNEFGFYDLNNNAIFFIEDVESK